MKTVALKPKITQPRHFTILSKLPPYILDQLTIQTFDNV